MAPSNPPFASRASWALLLTVAAAVCLVIAVLIFTNVVHSSLETGLAWAAGGWLALTLRLAP